MWDQVIHESTTWEGVYFLKSRYYDDTYVRVNQAEIRITYDLGRAERWKRSRVGVHDDGKMSVVSGTNRAAPDRMVYRCEHQSN